MGRYALNLLKRLPTFSNDIEFTFLIDPSLESDAVAQISGIVQLGHPGIRHLPSGFKNVATQLSLTRALSSCSFDLAHFLTEKDAPWSMNGPFCVSIMDTIPISAIDLYASSLQRSKNRLAHAVSSRVATKATAIITISEYSKKDIVKYFQIKPEHVHVIYLAPENEYASEYETSTVTKTLHKYGVPRSFYLYVGGIDPRKNILYLLDGYARYAAIKKDPEVLVMAGSISSQREYPEFLKRVRDLKLQSLVCQPGFVADEDLPILFAASKAFIFPSLYEGFGIPVLEAMSAGTPVITTKLTSIPEVAGNAALFVDPHRSETLMQALEAVSTNRNLAMDLIDKGRKQARKFSWDRTAEETLQFYINTIQEHHRAS